MRRWRSTIDGNTCPACRVLDGRRIRDTFTPPHVACASPNGCRCVVETTETPTSAGWLGFYLGAMAASVVRDLTAGDWWWVALDVSVWIACVTFIHAIDRPDVFRAALRGWRSDG